MSNTSIYLLPKNDHSHLLSTLNHSIHRYLCYLRVNVFFTYIRKSYHCISLDKGMMGPLD
jgi:hypothetical protein